MGYREVYGREKIKQDNGKRRQEKLENDAIKAALIEEDTEGWENAKKQLEALEEVKKIAIEKIKKGESTLETVFEDIKKENLDLYERAFYIFETRGYFGNEKKKIGENNPVFMHNEIVAGLNEEDKEEHEDSEEPEV